MLNAEYKSLKSECRQASSEAGLRPAIQEAQGLKQRISQNRFGVKDAYSPNGRHLILTN
jgi:hypothetical protein